ncbi:MAG: T9SS C-terminal target domain-containing protein [Bacteroidetes bacterium]|nr:MAG: T9SS C-terminal target domain-containing protein [Bacteroidota bacterium]REK05780.1 MAG: T9SS C-terminal target domain-containing protein [Bacteroidota bacterium]REK31915.1 MAG: T9SS C-terminal target domain-containing protein [Bacteroidota bacterium]REK49980.1 MAG: T9SS C-terminal target domain-containing protein [Bacteroidota bacterium]
MKTSLLTLKLFFLFLITQAQNSTLIDFKTIGNLNPNSFDVIRNDAGSLRIAGVTSGSTNVSLNSGVSTILSAHTNQDMFWIDADYFLQNTNSANFIEGTNYDFVREVEILKSPASGALMGMNSNGGVLNINTNTVNIPTPFGIIYDVDVNSFVRAWKTFSASVNFSLSDVKSSGTDYFIGASWGGSFQNGTSNFTSQGSSDGIIARGGFAGTNFQWAGRISAPGFNYVDKIWYDEDHNELYAVCQLFSSGDYHLGASSTPVSTAGPSNNVMLMKLNASNGTLLDHTMFYSTNHINVSGVFTTDNSVYVGVNINGNVFTQSPSTTINRIGSSDQAVLKFNRQLDFESSFVSGTNSIDVANRFRKARFGNSDRLVLTGFYSFDNTGTGGSFNQQASVLVLDENLNLIDSLVFGHSGYEAAYDADVDQSGFLYVVGGFNDTASFDPSGRGIYVVSQGAFDAFIAKFNAMSLGTFDESSIDRLFMLSPNPAKEHFTMEVFLPGSQMFRLEIYSQHGSLVHSEELTATDHLKKNIGIKSYSPGIYIVQVRTEDAHYTRKLLVMN